MRAFTFFLAGALLAACGSARTAPPAASTPGGDGAAATAHAAHAAADVRFMQMMIVHHEQALAMAALVPDRAARQDLRLLAERIDASQRDEIAQMKTWLGRRGEPAVLPHGEHAAHAMPGLLSAEEMERLRSASGAAFDLLFVESMIRHHEGALTMVAELYATPGAGQEPELFQFAQHVDADQRAEIARMRRLLAELR